MAFFRGKIVWSPVEVEYLKENREKQTINQLSLALSKSRNAIKRKTDELDGKKVTQNRSKRSVIGKREDLNHFFRSCWEANSARWFNHEGIIWSYEPKVFIFGDVRRGTVSYCPDFQIDNGWVEVKGLLDSRGRTAIRRFKKYYPGEFGKLKAIVGRPGTKADEFFKLLGVPVLAYYKDLEKEFKDKIANWE